MYYKKQNAIKEYKDELKLKLNEMATSTDYLITCYEGAAKAQWRAYRKALNDITGLLDNIKI